MELGVFIFPTNIPYSMGSHGATNRVSQPSNRKWVEHVNHSDGWLNHLEWMEILVKWTMNMAMDMECIYIYIWKATHVKNRRWMDMDGYGWIWMDMDGYGILENTVYQWNVNGILKLLMTYCWIEWDLIWMNLIMPSLNEMSSLE